MKYIIITLIIFVFIMIAGCTNSMELTSKGDMAEITEKNDSITEGELVVLRDSSLLIANKFDKTKEFLYKDLKSVKIIREDYNSQSWILPLLLCGIAPPTLFIVAAAAADGFGGALFLTYIPALISYLLFEAGSPEAPEVTKNINKNTMNVLRKYSKYPLGLSDEQIQILKINVKF